MKGWKEYLQKIRRVLLFCVICAASMTIVLFLYDTPVEPVIYVMVLYTAAGTGALILGHYSYMSKKENLYEVKNNFKWNLSTLSEPEDGNEQIYQELLRKAEQERKEAENRQSLFFNQLTDYYTMWVHQIKTPIAAARLLLMADGCHDGEVLSELFKIEQYVEMVLGYLRTEDISSDMKFVRCSLDEIVRDQIHKFARIFIGKKLTLEYAGVGETVLTDSKWLGFVIGQILSNSLKYTREGGISIYMDEKRPHTLVIADTGIGIKKEDLPRVFERGFTGCNGRGEEKSTGIGLYLCAKIMKKLGHEISMESEPGKGTKVFLFLGRKNLEMY